nr:hypothetical protein [Bradyrhizobium liaoningense]
MGKVIQFVPKSGWARARVCREARAIYDSVLPPSGTVSERQDNEAVIHIRDAADVDPVEGGAS